MSIMKLTSLVPAVLAFFSLATAANLRLVSAAVAKRDGGSGWFPTFGPWKEVDEAGVKKRGGPG